MRRWVIADLHFAHANVIEYSNRPFKDVDEMTETLISNWNSVVKNDDIVYILGDFTLTRRKTYIKSILERLNGNKVLIMGNHDTLRPAQYIELGFKVALRRPIMIDPGVILMHEPPAEEIIVPSYKFIFGHVHDKIADAEARDNCRCVSVERINYTPVDLDKLLKSIKIKKESD